MTQLRIEKRSQIADIIYKNMNKRVHPNAFHRKNCMEELASLDDKKTWYVVLDDATQNKDNMYIGGYGFGIDGTGADCPITNGVYSLHMFATKCDSNLGIYINLGNTHLTKRSKDIENLTRYITDGSLDAHLVAHPHENIEFAAGPIVTSKNIQMYAMGLLANIERHGLIYRGDITLRLDSELGRGQGFLNSEKQSISHNSHDSKIYNDMLRTESLKTKDVVFSRSLIGSSFRNAVFDRIESMKETAKQSGLEYDCASFMLRVENLYPVDKFAKN